MSRCLAQAVCAIVLLSCALKAQEIPKPETPAKEHQFLKRFVGEWETQAEAAAGPGTPATKCSGKIQAKMLGGFWVVCEMEADMGGNKFQALQTIGYNAKTKKYTGTWVDSMMNHMWKYEGFVDKTGKILTLESEGPNFMTGKGTAKYRDVYKFQSDDLMETSSQAQGDDGKWITFMTGTAKRKK